MNLDKKIRIGTKLYDLKKILFLAFIIIVILIIIIFKLTNYLLSDKMRNIGVLTTYYRTYTQNNGWSKWSKNGVTSGDFENKILNVQVKLSKKQAVVYDLYSNGKWINNQNLSDSNKNGINAIKASLYYENSKKYDLCYRTYNKSSKWMGWVCDKKGISGNKNSYMTAIQFKTIPKNVAKEDYLKDYNLNSDKRNLGF